MTTLQKASIATVLVAALAALLYLQQRALQKLRAENARASELAAAATREGSSNAVLTAADASELERLRRHQSELLRLRGEVARLRQQLAEVAPKRRAPVVPPTVTAEPGQPSDPVQVFVSSADAKVPAGQMLAFGGWITSPGKRGFVFLQPNVLERSRPGRVGSVFLQGQFIEATEEALTKVGDELNLPILEQLKVAGHASSTSGLLTAEEAESVLGRLKETPGVDILSAPRIQTGDGVQASLSVTQQKTIGTQEYALGPSLDVEPRISADGSSVNVTVSARLRLANPAQENAR